MKKFHDYPLTARSPIIYIYILLYNGSECQRRVEDHTFIESHCGIRGQTCSKSFYRNVCMVSRQNPLRL